MSLMITADSAGEFSQGAESVPRAGASGAPGLGSWRAARSLPLAVLIRPQDHRSAHPTQPVADRRRYDVCSHVTVGAVLTITAGAAGLNLFDHGAA